jgi:hypothetical protein
MAGLELLGSPSFSRYVSSGFVRRLIPAVVVVAGAAVVAVAAVVSRPSFDPDLGVYSAASA